jgi:predicted MFS family arabinose efflux permease|tara:strand:+ start:2803 stop:3999 length:1197 start_codon:yes stop_codon:yes gene_type:complete
LTNIAGSSAGPWRGATAALCALLVGIGLGRFAYTPLIPALAAAEWFTASDAAYLGAANLAGYLAGAALARMLAARTSTRYTLRGGMLLASVAFFACAQPFPFEWFFLWRFIAGMCGGILMVLAAPTVLPFVPANRQGLAGGVIMTGVALGIALSGTMVPLTLELGLTETWAALGILATLLTAIAWHGWPAAPNGGETAVKTSPPPGLRVLKSLYIEYCLNAMGLVPHMVFWVVFIVRGLNQGLDVGAMYWVVFGVGAMLGPVSMGYLADRIGSLWALRLGYLLQAVFVGVVAVTDNTAVLIASSLVMGAFVPASTTLVLIRLRHVIGHDAGAQTGGWRLATIAFAFGQAAGGYGLSYLFDVGSDYRPLYAVGSAALVLSLVLNFAAGQSGKAARIDQV